LRHPVISYLDELRATRLCFKEKIAACIGSAGVSSSAMTRRQDANPPVQWRRPGDGNSSRREPHEVETSETKVLSLSRNSTSGTGFSGDKADEYARAYAEGTPGRFALRMRQKRVLELFDRAGGKVLDVVCGPAEMLRPLLSLGCEFWGVDPSTRMIEICRARFGETKDTLFAAGEAGRTFQTNSSMPYCAWTS